MFYFSNLPTWLVVLHYAAWGIVFITVLINWNLGFGAERVSPETSDLVAGASFVSGAVIVATAIAYFSYGLLLALFALVVWAALIPRYEKNYGPMRGPYLSSGSSSSRNCGF